MEEAWQEALDGFDAVWQRVQGGTDEAPALPAPVAAPGEAAVLDRLLCCMAETTAAYHSVGDRAPEALRRLGGQCRQDLQRLRAEYFLQRGERFTASPADQPDESLPALLRRIWYQEQALNEALRAAELHGLCSSCQPLAEHSRQRRERVFELLCRVLG